MSTAVPILPPPLREGDRLSREEFLRRWEAMPELKHAELLDGIVHMPSPVSRKHSRYHFPLTALLANYSAQTPGCAGGVDGTWLMLSDVPQPDLDLVVLPEYGGQSNEEGIYSAGAPELVIELSSSSKSYDLNVKLRLYQRAGVREYLSVLLDEEQIIWRELAGRKYRNLPPSADGIFRSNIFPGLWLNSAAFWKLDLAALNATLNQGLATPEHAQFVARLAASAR